MNYALYALALLLIFGPAVWSRVSPLLGKIKMPSFSLSGNGALPPDIDVTDLAALKTVRERYKRMQCSEGIAATGVLFEHFFHEAAK